MQGRILMPTLEDPTTGMQGLTPPNRVCPDKYPRNFPQVSLHEQSGRYAPLRRRDNLPPAEAARPQGDQADVNDYRVVFTASIDQTSTT
ncbi:MAG: hypothetical protein JWP34_5284 [Massilia sp.]|jgi:hypothetical protein|nr:hypothetical protein [Massilia sp.]